MYFELASTLNAFKPKPMRKITVAKGDGIGPEIINATLETVKAAGAEIDIEEIVIGQKVYNDGFTPGSKNIMAGDDSIDLVMSD